MSAGRCQTTPSRQAEREKEPMLNFNDDRFVSIENAGLAVEPELDAIIARLLGDGARNLFFLGAGGVMFLTQPAYNLLRTRSTFPVFYEMGA